MRLFAMYLVMICSTIMVLLYAMSIDSSSVEADVTLGLATTTCPMAHCNQWQQGLIHITPIATPTEAWYFGELGNSDGEPVVGVLWALGATIGDGFVVVSVIYSATTSPLDTPAYVYALDLTNGERIWSSADFAASKTLDLSVANGAPLIASDGSIYVADDHITVKFFKNNSGEWTAASSSHNGLSSPFSFNITHEGDLVAADDEGHVWLTDPDDLSVIASTTLTGCCFGTPRWITRNTPAVAGSRVYIVTTLKNLNIPRQKCIRPFFARNDCFGRLYAFSINDGTLTKEWQYGYGGFSDANPTVITGSYNQIYFDGSGRSTAATSTAFVFGLRDLGTSYEVIWAADLTDVNGEDVTGGGIKIPTSLAVDPRDESLWTYSAYGTNLIRMSSSSPFEVIQTINVNELVGNSRNTSPSSVISVVKNGDTVVINIGAAEPGEADELPSTFNEYIVSIDVTEGEESLRWIYTLSTSSAIVRPLHGTRAQNPSTLVQLGEKQVPHIIIPTYLDGILALKEE